MGRRRELPAAVGPSGCVDPGLPRAACSSIRRRHRVRDYGRAMRPSRLATEACHRQRGRSAARARRNPLPVVDARAIRRARRSATARSGGYLGGLAAEADSAGPGSPRRLWQAVFWWRRSARRADRAPEPTLLKVFRSLAEERTLSRSSPPRRAIQRGLIWRHTSPLDRKTDHDN